jgi:hypothetical protein
MMSDRYSARNGYVEDLPQRQTVALDERTRNALWNAISTEVERSVNPLASLGSVAHLSGTAAAMVAHAAAVLGPKTIQLRPFVQSLWVEHRENRPSEVAAESEEDLIADVEDIVVGGELPAVFDMIEILVEAVNERDREHGDELAAEINRVFLRKNVAFQIADGLILPLSDEIQRLAVEKAVSDTSHLEGPRQQLELAAEQLRRGNWANSVANATNAVEGAAQSVLHDRQISLGSAVGKLKAQKRINPDVAAGWTRLYGLASNGNNIRHGGIHAADVTAELATYFLVTASAFVSYLLSLQGTSDIETAHER